MREYIGQLQAKVYRLDSQLIESQRNKAWDVYEMVSDALDDTLFELSQAEWMEEHK